MSKLGLTKEERNYIHRISHSYESPLYLVGFHFATLIPALALGLLGFVQGDIVYVDFAFFGLAFFIIWRVVGEVRYAPLFRSIFCKVEAFERDTDA